MPEEELKRRITQLELELEKTTQLLETRARAEAERVEEIKILKDRVAALAAENQKLMQAVERLRAERVKPSPTQLVQSFRKAIDALRAGLEAKPGDRLGYTVSRFDIELKSLVAVDKESQDVRFVLPEPGETFPAESLSTLRFALQAIPRPEVPEQVLIEVPTLLGLSRDRAAEALARAGLTMGEQTEQVSTLPLGTVIGQDPEAGDQVPPASAVRVVLARPAQVKVPLLLHLSRADAGALLEERGLRVGSVTEEKSPIEPGTVIDQAPEAETLVDPGTAVNLVVAKPQTAVVPRVIGRKEQEAIALLREAKLTPGQVTTRPTRRGIGTVLEQDPQPGVEVPPWTTVAMVIGVPMEG